MIEMIENQGWMVRPTTTPPLVLIKEQDYRSGGVVVVLTVVD